jgi:hypothetical protein
VISIGIEWDFSHPILIISGVSRASTWYEGEDKVRGRAQGIAPTMDEEEADESMVAKECFLPFTRKFHFMCYSPTQFLMDWFFVIH